MIFLQCIYNFRLFHAIISSFLDVLQSFYSNFISFFGTNLLTQCQLLFLLVFYIGGNQYQTESRHRETFLDFLWTRRPPMGQSSTWGVPRGGHNPPGRAWGPGAPRWVVPTSVASRTPSLPYKFPNIPKTLGVNLDQKFCRRKPLYPRTQSRPHSNTLPKGEIITGGHLHHPGGHHDEEGVVHPRG